MGMPGLVGKNRIMAPDGPAFGAVFVAEQQQIAQGQTTG